MSKRKAEAVQFQDTVSDSFVESLEGSKYRIRVIRAGLSGNRNFYPDTVLREAAPLFQGVRVFVKSDAEHLRGQGKDVRNLIGRLTNPRFIEGQSPDTGELQADLELLDSAEVSPKLREAVARDMADDLFGFSIDADGQATTKPDRIREATKILRVKSVDLIIEPGAGGKLLNLIEAINDEQQQQEQADVKLRQRMIEAVQAAHNGTLPADLDIDDDDALEAAYREAVQHSDDDAKQGRKQRNAGDDGRRDGSPAPAVGVTMDEVEAKVRMVEARSHMRVAIAESGLPDKAKQKLRKQFGALERFTEAQVDQAVTDEREYLASFSESGRVTGLGGNSRIESGEDRAEKVTQMLDDFFNPDTRSRSFRECYIDITGDKGVTGLMHHCDTQRLREAVGEMNLREAINAATFSNVLGDSITRALLREYNLDDPWSDWRWLVDVVSVRDFRTQERTRVGGYGNLPVVAEDGPYTALTTPDDEKATYALEKRGGTETLSLESIANDDVGLIQRIPMKLGVAAKRTLYEFVLDFLSANGNIYDGAALFHASHGNLSTAALANATFAAMRQAMLQQAERDSAKKLGLILRHIAIPDELEETAFDMFVRGTNNDETFVQSRKPMVHVVPHWTDANNWYGTADKRQTPLIELGFYNGQEEPELFVQDSPSQGSLFSNDQIKYKIRHIYKGAVMDYRGFQGAVVA